jgi:hypothetical protein
MIWNQKTFEKLSVLFNIKYTDEFAHFEIGEEGGEIPAWENYLEEIGVSRCTLDPYPSTGQNIFLRDPRFINIYRVIPGELAEKVLVLGEFPGVP